MARARLSYEERLRRNEARQFTLIKRQQTLADRKREREIKQQERLVNIAVQRHENEIQKEAMRRHRRKSVSHRKTKRMLKKVWRKLI